MKTLISILFEFTIFCTIISCSSDVVQTNPCDGYKEVQSRIVFSEVNGTPSNGEGFEYETDDDTMCINTNFRISIFSPNYTQKKIYLGIDPKLRKDSSIYRITDFVGTIPVVVYLSDYKDSLCNKNFKKFDTIRRNLVIVPWEKSKLIGEFWGCNLDNPTDSFMIRLKIMKINPKNQDPNAEKEMRIFNFNKGCYASGYGYDSLGNKIMSEVGINGYNKTLYVYTSSRHIDSKDSCAKPEGFGFINNKDELEIHYSMRKYLRNVSPIQNEDSLKIRENHIYIGKRIR